MSTVVELFRRLEGDPWRLANKWNDDILQANALLHNTAATEEEMAECLELWCRHNQPCQFGRAAATKSRIHFCFLRDEAVSTWKDEEIAKKIEEERRLWKQRGVSDPENSAHSFVIVVSSPRVAFAAPNQQLREFSDRLLELSGWGPTRKGVRRKNEVTSDYLYLKKPGEDGFYGFQFNADFFACAADKRWWRDHRFPGGIAFTANSTGHMIRFRDWYESQSESRLWALKQSMFTIANAAQTKATESADPVEQGRVTWLRDLENGKPFAGDAQCPLGKLPRAVDGKDWSRYEGYLHTDHSVREEFFTGREMPPTTKRHLMDFSYLYDEQQSDHEDLVRGKRFSEEEVFAEIGRPDKWTVRSASVRAPRTADEAVTVAAQLDVCRSWKAPDAYPATD